MRRRNRRRKKRKRGKKRRRRPSRGRNDRDCQLSMRSSYLCWRSAASLPYPFLDVSVTVGPQADAMPFLHYPQSKGQDDPEIG